MEWRGYARHCNTNPDDLDLVLVEHMRVSCQDTACYGGSFFGDIMI